jgi:hypothetical protein
MALTDNIAAYWKFDESSGNASDATGNGKTLTNTGTVGYSAGKINNAADFGATNSGKYFIISDNLSFQNAMSYSFWFNCTTDISSTGNQYILLDNRTTGAIAYIQILYRNQSGTRTLRFVSGDNITGYDINMGTGTWYHIVGTRSSSGSTTLYVNGSSVATGSSGGVSGGANWCVVGDDSGGGGRTQGLIDACGVWNRELTSSEVTELYNSGTGKQYPFGNAYNIVYALGTFALTVNNVLFYKALKMLYSVGSYTLTLFDVLFARGKGIFFESGQFVLSIKNVILRRTGWRNSTKNSTNWTEQNKSSTNWTYKDKNQS